MGIVCSKCGTDNREKAMFCLGCGGRLTAAQDAVPAQNPAWSVSAPQASPSLPDAGQPPAPAGAQAADSAAFGRQRTWSVVGLLLAAAALAFWFHLHQQKSQALSMAAVSTSSTASTASRPAPVEPAGLATKALPDSPPAALVPDATAQPVDGSAARAAELAEAERLNALKAQNDRLSRQRLEREKRERLLAAQEQTRATQALERPRAEQEGRQAQAPGPQPAPPRAAEPAPTQRGASALSVGRQCDQAGNFFAREVCRLRECSKPARANDAVCLNFRRMEEASRAGPQYN